MRLAEREEKRRLRVPITSSTLPSHDQDFPRDLDFRRPFIRENRWVADPAYTGRVVVASVESTADTLVWSRAVDFAYLGATVDLGAVTASSDDEMSQEPHDVRVSERDYETIAAALKEPPAPSPALQKAVEIYRAR